MQLFDRFGGASDIHQHPAVLMVLASAIQPTGGDGAFQQAFPTDPVVPIEQHGFDVQRLAVLAVDRDRAVGRLAATRARLLGEPTIVRAHCNFPIRAGDRRPTPGKVRNGSDDPLRGNQGFASILQIGVPMSLAKLHVVPEDCVGQRLVIGGRAEQSAADHIAGIDGDVARDSRDFIPVVVEGVGPQGCAGALVGHASDDTDRVSVPLDRPAQAHRRALCLARGADAVETPTTPSALNAAAISASTVSRMVAGKSATGVETRPGAPSCYAPPQGPVEATTTPRRPSPAEASRGGRNRHRTPRQRSRAAGSGCGSR